MANSSTPVAGFKLNRSVLLPASFGFATATLFGTSREQEQFNDQTLQAGAFEGGYLARSSFNAMQKKNGCPFVVVQNAGKSGDTLEMMLNRIDSTDVGVLSAGYNSASVGNPGVTPFASDFVFMYSPMVNSLAIESAEAAIATLEKILAKLSNRKVVITTEPYLGNSAAGYPGASNIFLARILKSNQLLMALTAKWRNLIVVDITDLSANPLSASGRSKTGFHRDDDKHFASPHSFDIADRVWAAIVSHVRTQKKVMSSSATHVITTNSSIAQYCLDPVFSGGVTTPVANTAINLGVLVVGSSYPTSRKSLAASAAGITVVSKVAASGTAIVTAGSSQFTVLNVTTVLNNPNAVTTSTAGLTAGMAVLGNPNIPATTRILSITNGTDFVLDTNATAAGTLISSTFRTPNVGNGALGTVTVRTVEDEITGLQPAVPGDYTVQITATAANAGTFSVTGQDGLTLKNGTVGVAYSDGGLSFTLADGTTDFALNDKFTITVHPHNLIGNGWMLDGTFTASGQNVQPVMAESIANLLGGATGLRMMANVKVFGPGGSSLQASHNVLTVEGYLRKQIPLPGTDNHWRRDMQSSSGDQAWVGSKDLTYETPPLDFEPSCQQAHMGFYIRSAGAGGFRVYISQATIAPTSNV